MKTLTVDLGTCCEGYCDRPAVTYLSWTGDRVTFIVGPRADFLAHAGPADGHVLLGPLALRCLDCAHHALDALFAKSAPTPSGGTAPTAQET